MPGQRHPVRQGQRAQDPHHRLPQEEAAADGGGSGSQAGTTAGGSGHESAGQQATLSGESKAGTILLVL